MGAKKRIEESAVYRVSALLNLFLFKYIFKFYKSILLRINEGYKRKILVMIMIFQIVFVDLSGLVI